MSNTPLPEPNGLMHYLRPDGSYVNAWSADQMHTHAAAVSAAKDARIKVLEDALRELVGACDDDSATRFEDALSAARAALEQTGHNDRVKRAGTAPLEQRG